MRAGGQKVLRVYLLLYGIVFCFACVIGHFSPVGFIVMRRFQPLAADLQHLRRLVPEP